MTPEDRINAVKQRLTSMVAPNVVSRNYDDVDRFEERDKAIYIVISAGFPSFGSLYDEEDEQHEFMILAQQYVPDGTTGDVRESMEFDFLGVIRRLVKEDGIHHDPLNIELKKVHQSRQQDPNRVWILAELQFNDL